MAKPAIKLIEPRFPASPNDGDRWTEGGKVYEWDQSLPGWRLVPGATPPGPVEEAPEDGVVYGRKDATWVEIEAGGRFEWSPPAAQTVWTVPHNLGIKYVSTQVVDTAGNTVISDVDWPGSTTTAVRLIFANAKQGTAIVRR